MVPDGKNDDSTLSMASWYHYCRGSLVAGTMVEGDERASLRTGYHAWGSSGAGFSKGGISSIPSVRVRVAVRFWFQISSREVMIHTIRMGSNLRGGVSHHEVSNGALRVKVSTFCMIGVYGSRSICFCVQRSWSPSVVTALPWWLPSNCCVVVLVHC